MNEIAILEKQVNEGITKANSLIITNLGEYSTAVELSLSYKRLEKEIKKTFDPIVSKALETHREAVAQRKKHLDPVIAIQGIIDSKAIAWRYEEKNRQENERRAKEEEAKRNEEDLRLAEAAHFEKQGNKEAAQAVLEAPIVAPAVAMPEPPRVTGFSVTKSWTYEIQTPDLLPREFLMPDERKIGGVVRALQDNANIPGVRVFCMDNVRKTVR